MNYKRKRVGMVVIWLLFLCLASVLLYILKKQVIEREAVNELSAQSFSVADQLDMMLENDYLVQIVTDQMETDKLKALAVVLDRLGSDDEIRSLLEDYKEKAQISGLEIYNKDAEVLFAVGEKPEAVVSGTLISQLLNEQVLAYLDDLLQRFDIFRSVMLTNEDLEGEAEGGTDFWGAKDYNWFLLSESPKKEEKKLLNALFSWKNVLSRVVIGRSGFVMAADSANGTLLSYADSGLEGESLEVLDIHTEGSSEAATIAALQEIFNTPGAVVKLEMQGKAYYASRADVDDVFVLALLPMEEIGQSALREAILLMLIVFLVSGVYMIYTFFHVRDHEESSKENERRYVWNTGLGRKLHVVSFLAMIILLLCGTLAEGLSVYAETFSYCSRHIEDVVTIIDKDSDSVESMMGMYDDNLLVGSRIAGCFVSHLKKEDLTDSLCEELADAFGVRYIYIFDSRGKVFVTNSPYDRVAVDSSSPFNVLLQGRDELLALPEYDEMAGETLQRSAVSLRAMGDPDLGMIMLVTDDSEIEKLSKNLGADHAFERVALSDSTYVMSIGAEDLVINNAQEVINGIRYQGMGGSDFSGLSVSEIEMNENCLRDRFNGVVHVLSNSYFASVRRVGDNYFMVMRPAPRLTLEQMIPFLSVAGLTLVCFLLLIVFSCLHKKDEECEADIEDEEMKPEGNEEAEKMIRREDDVLAMLDSFINRNKPYFEERWPDDSVKWKDKTTDEKFKGFMSLVVLLTTISLLIYGIMGGEDSVGYFYFRGDWEKGINLYSFVSCIMIVLFMIISKMIIHKLLFLTARAVSSKGETICHLMDSFSGYAIAIVGVFLCLASCGVNTKALSLTGGVMGVVFGIGCQNIVADILAGILMTFEGVARAGDFVSFNDKYGVILSIGVRTIKLKWFSEITSVRNNDFKNFIYMPADKDNRVVTGISIDLRESLERVEEIIERELPVIHERLNEDARCDVAGPKYRGVQNITENSIVLSFAIFCHGRYYGWMRRALNRELKLMCERNGINLAMPQVVVQEPIPYPELKKEIEEEKPEEKTAEEEKPQ